MRIEIMNLFKGGKNKFFFFMPSIYLSFSEEKYIWINLSWFIWSVCILIYSPE